MKQNNRLLYYFVFIFLIQVFIVGNMTFIEAESLSFKKLILFTLAVLGLLVSVTILIFKKNKK